MLSILYPISFFISLLGLILWFYYQDNRTMSRTMSTAFLGGFLVYLFSLAFSDGALSYKLLILFRDLLVLAVVSQFFSFFRKYKLVFFGMLALLYGSFHIKLFDYWQQTFPQPFEQVPMDMSLADQDAEFLMELNEAHRIKDLEDFLTKYALTYERAFQPKDTESTELDDYYLINIPKNHSNDAGQIAAELRASKLIDWLEINETINLEPSEVTASRKTLTKRVYGINDPGIPQLWGFDEMNIDQLYAALQRQKWKIAKKARIFILDTGIDATHEDLAANYRSFSKKYDNDPVGHGTHCAGIAAAVSNNGKGIASFSIDNRFVEVTSVKVLNSFGGGTQHSIIKGILEAADNGADVISMSLGGRSSDSRQRAYEKAVAYANSKGAIVVVAAGNSNSNAKGYAPANASGVITVAAVDTQLNRASFSNFVTDIKMGIAAPGVQIYSTIPGNKYAYFNGTSMATPYVAGLLGLMKSIKPELTTKEAYRILKKSGIKSRASKETGSIIQPANALKLLLDK